MAHKSSPRKSLKSLFSRGEAQPGQPAEKDASQRGGEKKKFKFPKLKIKTKRSSEEADSGSQQALSAAEPTETVENGEALADGVVPDKKKSFLYATAPRSKSKEFSYSELDLRKPKRFATFSFGLKKRRKDEDSISKSTFGLHSPGIKEQEETNLDVSQMELDQANSKRFSMSQPELDTSVKFDIPSPPAVATNQSEPYFTLPNQSQSLVTINTQPESEEALKNGSKLLDVHEETPKAPIASIPELQLDDQEWNNPVGDYSSSKAATFPAPVTHAASISVDTQAAPSPPARQHPVTHDASSPEAAVLTPRDNDFLQQPYTNNEISLAESTSATLSHHQPDAPDTADGGEPPSLSVDSKTDATITESTPVPHDDDDSSTIREVSASCTDGILPEAANSVTTTSAISSKKMTPSSADVIYDTLYESLFPQSFTSEVMSSLSNPPPQICTDVRQLKANPEPIMLKTLHEHYKETNFTYSRPSSSRDSAACGVDQAERRLPENFEVATSNERFTRHQSSAVTDPQANKDISPSHSPAGEEIPYSELICSQSKVKSDNLSLFGDAGGAVSAVHNSAPPAPEYVTPQGTDTQVTGSKGRVILVKESLSDKTAVVSDCPSPVPNKMSTLDDLELKIETSGGPFAGSGLVEAPEGLLSPVYLSLGSDDGSVVEVYYSAEEDHVEESGEEDVYTIQEGEELCAAEGVKEIAEKGRSGRDEGDSSDEEEMQREASKIEAGTSEFLSCNDAKRTEVEVAAAAFPQVKQEGEEGGGEELPATLVRQGMVCDVGPPSCEQHVQGECSDGNLTRDLETEDHWKEEKQPPSQEIENLACKDTRSVRFVDTACSDTAEDVITPTPGEAGEQVSADRREESSQETNSNATTSAGAEFVRDVSAHIPELQSDAIEIEHNRALQSSEWADTITPSAGRKGSGPEQAAVELSNSNPETLRPEAAAEATSERPAEAQTDQDPGSLTVSRTSAAASESQQTKVDQGLVDEMNSGYGSLSTKVTIKHLAPLKEDEATNRFHKVSLIAEGDRLSQDTEDSTKTTRTESDEYKWRNNFEGVFQYKPQPAEESSFSDSLSNKISDPSSLFSSSEATAHKPFSSMFSSFAPAPEERFTLDSRLYDGTNVYLSHESEPEAEPQYEWRRRSGLVEQEEPAAPVGERRGEAESERIKSRWDSQQLPASGFPSPLRTSHADAFEEENGDCSSEFTGVFKATLVVLDPAAPPSTPPGSPETDSPIQFEMDNLVDTLRSMGPSLRPRTMGQRLPPQGPISSLPPIVEDASSPATADTPDSVTSPAKTMDITPAEPLNGVYLLPADLGLKRNSSRDTRSPLELMKQQQQDQQPQSGARGLNLPQRASAINSNLMRKPSDSSPEDLKSPVLNGNGLLSSSNTGSRLENSVIYGGYMSSSVDQTAENGKAQRSLYRSGSLPETGPLSDRVSVGPKELTEISAGKDPVGSRFDRISFLLSSSTSGSMTGAEDPNARMSRPPPLGIGSPTSSNSPTRLLSPTGSVDLHRPFVTPDSPLSLFNQTHGMGLGAGAGNGTLGTPILQRSFSSEGTVRGQQTSLFNSVQTKEPELDRNSTLKYRAFPDAYLTKEKEHGKLNPRPGKMYIFDRPGMCGQRIEVCSDVVDAQSWELQETISIRVVRGGWVLYEKPNFKGEKIALDEGDIVLTNPFSPPEELLQNGQEDGETSDQQADTQPARKFVIGSVRRAVRDYSVPEICLFPEENAEGKKVIFRDTSDDARIFGFPIKSNSVIINAGLWLVYAEPFFQGVPRVLEVGGYPNPAAWGVENPYVGSLHPLKIGEPRVENMHEPKIEIYDKPYFCGKSRIITANMKDFMTRTDRQQTVFMYSVGSLRVLGGIWVGYEKEGFRGHQYLLEEGEYHDWRVWGGCDAELRSVRVIRADLSDPMMVMFEQPEEDQDGMQENTFEVTEAIPDVELFGYKTSTRSIHVISGAWVAYSHVDFSGDQYILEKGFYNNCADWGSQDTHICSVQPVLQAPRDNMRSRTEIILYSEPDFRGQCHIFDRNHDSVSEKFLIKSCRVVGGHWVVYENQQFSGNMYVLLEGDYPNLTSMGCPPNCTIRSVKVVPMTFSVPSISLFGLECLEGREITTETEIINMAEEGFNDHFLSVRVNSGCWVVCEHSNYRGRQFLLEPIEITNWPKFSSLHTIGSMYPVRQKRHFLRIKNNESGHYMSVQGGMEELKSGRVVATEEVEPMSDIWYYQDGFIKNKLSPNMSLQVMGNIEPAAKVVMWTETRQPTQTWTAKMRGLITSLTFPGMVLDVKGGKSYDKDHLVIMPENEERPSQQWIIELL